jgi:hypothetical protein
LIQAEGGIAMRRTIITAVAATALMLPGAALASHTGERHHRRHHEIHHRHAHIVTFGAAAASSTSGVAGTVAPTSPAGTTDETAGKIASFLNGTLTITLTDGSSVSGKVTESTAIECRSTMASAASDGGPGGGDQSVGGPSGGQGDENDASDDRGHDGQSNSGPGDGGQSGESQGQGQGEQGDDAEQDEGEHCTTGALVPGAVVREAELSVSSAGSVWQKVELGQ